MMLVVALLVVLTSPVCAVLRGGEAKSKFSARLPYKFKYEDIEKQLRETEELIK